MRPLLPAALLATVLVGCSEPATQQTAAQEPAMQQPTATEFFIHPVAEVTGPLAVTVTGKTNLPDGAVLGISMGLAGQNPDDVYIGTQGPQEQDATVTNGEISAELNGAAIGDLPALPAGDYEVRVVFSPMWDANKSIAAKLGIPSEMGNVIEATTTVTLEGSGESRDAAVTREEGQRWVVQNIGGSSPWNEDDLVERFGEYEEVPLASGSYNPDIIHMYYFPTIDMTFMVNVPQKEIAAWRMGKADR